MNIELAIDKDLTIQVQDSPVEGQKYVITFYDKDLICIKEVRLYDKDNYEKV